MNNPYQKMAAEYARLLTAHYPLGEAAPCPAVTLDRDAPTALLFSPHPDDECITGGLPLRLLRERRWRVLNVAVTLGSRKERRLERLEELRRACDYLGFGVLTAAERGLENINPDGRARAPQAWAEAVRIVAELLRRHAPRLVFLPHAQDANTTHRGTHLLVNDALRTMPPAFCCSVCETEFWAPLETPNLMVESSVADVADLVTALSFHVGEVGRNPYHLRLPAWLQDNVRRGAELVGGQGTAAPAFVFATLYRCRPWVHGAYPPSDPAGKLVACGDPLDRIAG